MSPRRSTARPQDVYGYIADPTNLPGWAHGLAEADVELVDGTWTIASPMGTVTVAFAPANELGVVDHDVTLPTGRGRHQPAARHPQRRRM